MSSGRVASSICCLIFSFCLQVSIVVDAAPNSISQGQSITHPESIVSSGKMFELGFFKPGNSTNYYLGIWYHQITPQTVVWVANRDLPLKSTSAALTINNDGNIVITDGRIDYRVSENSSSQNTTALLRDSGNLILRNEKSEILWQSFDYPSNTFLPGMKLGYNKKTGRVWSLTSWRTAEDPSLGPAELRLDAKEPNQFLLMSGSQIVWISGVWDGNIFSLVPEMRPNYIFNYGLYSDENEIYFTYSLKDSTISRLFLDTSGQIKQMNWLEDPHAWFLFWNQPKTDCEAFAFCGPFSICRYDDKPSCQCLHGFRPSDSLKRLNRYSGCERRIPLKCDVGAVNGYEDDFLRMKNVHFPFNETKLTVQTAEECKLTCFNNCSCTAYAYNERAVCSLWYGELLNLRQVSNPSGQTIYLKLTASEIQNPEGDKKLIWVIALIVSLVILLGLGSYIIYQWRRKLKQKEVERSQDMLLFDINMSIGASMNEFSNGERAKGKKSKDSWLPFFSFSSVSAATDNFSTENKLGEGGFGPVYKGKLLNGQEVAVKRLSRQSAQGLEELKNETILIAKLQHRNLVRLLGCCIENGEKILIYEFMPNKSLDSFLFDQTKRGLLDWGTRVKIIEGIAQGLLYLHQYSRLRIIHRDLKASNILLDGDMNPKISDFGMARMFGGDELQANTNHIVGTYGYMPPEYALQGLFSIKSDVFSFGVLMLETLSSKKNTGFYNTDSLNLLTHAWELWNNDKALELIDPILETEATNPMPIRYINVALLCVQEVAADRPTMSEVVSMLTNEHIILSTPKQPAFSYLKTLQNSVPPNRGPGACSVNNVTLSLIESR